MHTNIQNYTKLAESNISLYSDQIYAHNNTILFISLKCISNLSLSKKMNLSMRIIEDMHGCKPNINSEKDNKKMARCIDEWIGREGRNDLGTLNRVQKRYG